MPTARKEGQRVRAGTYTSSGITASYAISAYAAQSDQGIVLWRLDGKLTTPPQRARRSILGNGAIREDGFWRCQLGFSYLTFGMVSYLQSAWFASAASAAVSVMVYNPSDTAVYLNGILYQPVWGQTDSAYAPGGYRDVVFRFEQGVTTA